MYITLLKPSYAPAVWASLARPPFTLHIRQLTWISIGCPGLVFLWFFNPGERLCPQTKGRLKEKAYWAAFCQLYTRKNVRSIV